MNILNIIWVAGILEGEGTFRLRNGITPGVSCVSTDQDVIKRLLSYTNMGTVYKPKKQQEHHKQAWLWVVESTSAIELMKNIHPYMLQRRAAKIQEVLDGYDALTALRVQKAIEKMKIHNDAARAYLDGKGSLRDIGKKYGLSYVTVKNHADAMREHDEIREVAENMPRGATKMKFPMPVPADLR